MTEEFKKIKDQIEQLSFSINEFLKYSDNDVLIIYRDDFHNIKHLGKSNSYIHVFCYNNLATFTLPNSQSYAYEHMHYTKLFSGELERLILKKRRETQKSGEWIINYELESQEETKLRDLYKNI